MHVHVCPQTPPIFSCIYMYSSIYTACGIEILGIGPGNKATCTCTRMHNIIVMLRSKLRVALPLYTVYIYNVHVRVLSYVVRT